MSSAQTVSDIDYSDSFYRYLPAEVALSAIQMARLKVSRIDQLNDVYDCFPQIIDDHVDDPESFTRAHLRHASRKIGIISFCGDPANLLVWSHYGRSHTGVALGFSKKSSIFTKACIDIGSVKYPESNERPAVDLSKREGIGILDHMIEYGFLTKGIDWSYEKETRAFLDLDECDIEGENFFVPINVLSLTRIILGSRCRIAPDIFERSLKREYQSQPVLTAFPHQRQFGIAIAHPSEKYFDSPEGHSWKHNRRACY